MSSVVEAISAALAVIIAFVVDFYIDRKLVWHPVVRYYGTGEGSYRSKNNSRIGNNIDVNIINISNENAVGTVKLKSAYCRYKSKCKRVSIPINSIFFKSIKNIMIIDNEHRVVHFYISKQNVDDIYSRVNKVMDSYTIAGPLYLNLLFMDNVHRIKSVRINLDEAYRMFMYGTSKNIQKSKNLFD